MNRFKSTLYFVLCLALTLAAVFPAGKVFASTNAAAFSNASQPATNPGLKVGGKVVVMNIALSNSAATTLDAITFTNTGTAIEAASSTTDIVPNGVQVYLDSGSGSFEDGVDTLIGTATRTANTAWALDTNQALGAANARIFVTVKIAQTATNGHTFIWRIPTLNDVNANGAFNAGDVGVYYASTDDGPADTNVTNSNTLTINTSNSQDDNTTIITQAAPTGVTVGSATTSSLTVSWTAASGAGSYRIFRANSTDNTGGMIAEGVTGTSYVDTGLMAGTKYYYLVQAVNTSGVASTNQTQTAGTTTSVVTETPSTPATPTTPTTPTTPSTPAAPAAPTAPVVVNPAGFDYRAAWVSQSGTVSADGKAHEVTGAAGSTVELSLTLKNIGGAWWYPTSPDGAHLIKLGTWNPADGLSSLEHGTWLAPNRIVQTTGVVKTGENYTFTFKVNVPQGASGTSFNLYVRPVAEWVKWFGPEGIFWKIKIA